MENTIPFNKFHQTGKELLYISQSLEMSSISGNGFFSKKCQRFFQEKYAFNHNLLTTSCTDALEMTGILADIKEGDEVIIPSFTFVSTANAFALRGAKIVFADSKQTHPCIDETLLEELITERTKAIIIVHYAGVSCNMQSIISICKKYNILLIEDAAQAIDSYYLNNGKKIPLGSIGDMSTFSFHETKNISSGEGGLLVINNNSFKERSYIIWEKGTNRHAFFKGEVDKYGWVDIGSSFLPSEILAAFLYAQLESLDQIQKRRLEIWHYYFEELKKWAENKNIELPFIPDYSTNNAHMFYLVCETKNQREDIIGNLKKAGVNAVFHYQSLHSSSFFKTQHDGRQLICADKFSDNLLRLPLYVDVNENRVIDEILKL